MPRTQQSRGHVHALTAASLAVACSPAALELNTSTSQAGAQHADRKLCLRAALQRCLRGRSAQEQQAVIDQLDSSKSALPQIDCKAQLCC